MFRYLPSRLRRRIVPGLTPPSGSLPFASRRFGRPCVLLAATLGICAGGTLTLALTPRPAWAQAARTFTWTGSGGNSAWETNGNWDSNLDPDSTTTAVSFLTGVANTLAVLNADHKMYGITFGYDAGKTATSFTISSKGTDNTLLLYNGGITNNTALTQTIDAPIALETSQSFSTIAGGTLSFLSGTYNQINLLGNTLNITGAGSTNIASKIVDTSGSGGQIAEASTGTLTLSNIGNSFTGNLAISQGTLVAATSQNSLNPATSVLGSTMTNGRTVIVGDGTNAATLDFGASQVFGTGNSNPAVSLVVNAGSTITNAGGQFNILPNLTLNGGTLTGTGGMSESQQMYAFAYGSVTVGGSSMSTISGSGANSGYHLGGSTIFNVADATGNSGADLLVSGNLIDNFASNGAGSLVKTGAGTMTLSGANSYTGTTTISQGELSIGGDNNIGTGLITLNGGLLGWSGGSETFGKTVSLGSAATGSGFDIISSGANLTVASSLTGSGGLTKTGAGTLTLSNIGNSFTGNLALIQGTLVAAASQTTLNPTTSVLGSTMTNGRTLAVGDGTHTATLNFAASNVFGTGNSDPTVSLVVNAGSRITNTGGAFNILPNVTLNGGTLAATGGMYSLAFGTVTASGSNSTISGSGSNTGYYLGGSTTFDIEDPLEYQISTLTVSGNLVDNFGGNGAGSLVKTGAGFMQLTGANTYTGTTMINQGILSIGNDSNTGTGTIVLNGGLLEWTGSSETFGRTISLGSATTGSGIYLFDLAVTGGTNLTVNSSLTGAGSLTLAGYGTLTLTGANTYTGGTVIGIGDAVGGGFTVDIGNSTTSSSLGTGSITNNSILNFYNTANLGSATINNYYGLSFYNNTSAGTATINNSSGLYLFDNSGTGSATINNNGGAIYFEGASTAGSATFISNRTSVYYGGLDISRHTGGLSIGELSGSGAIYLGGNALTIGGMVTGSSTIDTISGTIQDGAESDILNSGATTPGGPGYTGGSLVKAGSGTLVLSGSNTYTGGTTINSGELSISSDANVGTGAITLNGALLQWTGGSATLGRTVVLGSAATGSGFDVTNNGSNLANDPLVDLTVGSSLTGSGSLIKIGIGTLTLTGANTYTGTTTIDAGFLNVGTSSTGGSLGSGAITINSGTALGFYGTASAGNAPIINDGGLSFFGSSTAGSGGITNNGGTIGFNSSSDAGSATLVNSGTVDFNDTSTAGSADIVNNSGATVDLSGHTGSGSLSIGELSGAGTISLGASVLAIGGGVTNSGTVDTISGTIQDQGHYSGSGGSLVKAGAGMLVLTGANTYTGGTTISGGTLVAQGTALGRGSVTVSSGGTLAVGEAANSGGASLTTHSLSISSLLLAAGSTTPLLTFNLGPSGTSDGLKLTGSGDELKFSGSGIFDVGFASATGGSLSAGTYTLMTFATPESLLDAPAISAYTATATGNLGSVKTSAGSAGNGFAYLTNSSGQVTGLSFTISGAASDMPEPTPLALLASLGLAGIPAAVLRRRKHQSTR